MFMGHLCFRSFNKYCLSTSPVPSTVWISFLLLSNICTYRSPIFLLGCFSEEFFMCSGDETSFIGYVLQTSSLSLRLAFLLYGIFRWTKTFHFNVIVFLFFCLLKAFKRVLPFKFKTLHPFETYSYVLYEEKTQFLSFYFFPQTKSSGITAEWSLLYLLIYNPLFAMSYVPMYMYGSV